MTNEITMEKIIYEIIKQYALQTNTTIEYELDGKDYIANER